MSLIRDIKRIVPTVLLVVFLFIVSSVLVPGCSSGRTTNQLLSNEPVAGKTKVVFSEWGNENGRIISTISTVALGVGKKELLFKQNGQVDGLKVSPDNKWLAYFTSPDLLYMVDLHGENRRALDDSVLGWANWSPDSSRLAYVKTVTKGGKDRKHLAKYNVVVVNRLDGSGRKLIGLGKFKSVPCAVLGWYPDGKQLAVYASGGSEAENTLLKVDLTTRKVAVVAKNALLKAFDPDGDLNVVRPTRPDNGTGKEKAGKSNSGTQKPTWEIWKISESTGMQQVTRDRLPSSLASWSADSKRVVFSKVESRYGMQLYVATASGAAAKRITDLPRYDSLIPLWARDDASIVFCAIQVTAKNPGAYFYYYDIKNDTTSPLIKDDGKPLQTGVLFAVYE